MSMHKEPREKKKVDVIFTGLVRAPEKFKKSIADMVKLRKEGLINKIIFSTWDYEAEKNSEIISFLGKNNVIVIATKEPEDRGIGNIWCQMKSLDVGLSKIDEDRFVLKNRTDIYINPNFLRELFNKKESLLKINRNLPNGNIFKYKVWVHYYELKTPFHMGEECFFGHHHDIKLLVNYDKSYDEKYKVGDAISHIRKFIHPFLNNYPILYDYLKTYSKDSFLKTLAIKFSHKIFEVRGFKIARKISAKNKFNNLEKKLKDDKFINILATYYSILHSHFHIDGSSFKNLVINVPSRPESAPGAKLDPIEFKKNLSALTHPTRLGQVYIHDMELLSNICNNKLNKDAISERLMKAIKRFNVKN